MKRFVYDLRLTRRANNQLMPLWLRRDLKELAGREVALDVGCGKFINRKVFLSHRYIGVDTVEKNLIAGEKRHPNVEWHVGSVLDKLPEQADIVVYILVLNNKHFPHEKTVGAVDNLISAVRPGGDLLFSMGQVNVPYESDIDAMLSDRFETVSKKVYGRYNTPTYFSYPLAWMMDAIPAARIDRGNRMLYYRAKNCKNLESQSP